MKRIVAVVVAVLTAVVCSSSPLRAGFDLGTSIGNHTSPGAIDDWSFGRINSLGDPSSFSEFTKDAYLLLNNQLAVWTLTGEQNTFPMVVKNLTSNVVAISSVIWQPDQVGFHPGFQDASLGVVRYTVGAAGIYNLVGAFDSVDKAMGTGSSDGVDVMVRVNSQSGTTQLLSNVIANYAQPAVNFGFANLVLSIGDTVDFLVGQRNNYLFDGTSIAATFLPVAAAPAESLHAPQPASVFMMAAGLLALAFFARRRRASAEV